MRWKDQVVAVSTNFYLRRKKSILCFPEFHIGKRSCGWKPLMQSNQNAEDTFEFETQRPIVQSVGDIEDVVGTGEWEIVDEYGTEYSVDDFRSYMLDDFPIEAAERQTHVGIISGCRVDEDGFEWTDHDFF